MQNEPLTLLCVSHLRWDHVWQRPQQLMSRFATRCRVIYVDPPEITNNAEQPHLAKQPGIPGVDVIRPIFPKSLLDTPDHTYRELWLGLVSDVLAMAGSDTILWVFSPLADYLVEATKQRITLAVYDCMDDLASFKDGTAQIREREAKLFSLVDLVFTGGRSMYEARKSRHPSVHCFPSGVDLDHYRAVSDPATPIPGSVAAVPQPRLGYFGVLDERIDWLLIAEIAERRPNWYWILVGPTAKVDEHELPSAPNIHYLGQQQYRDLPAFLKSFDIATMPFALNDATKFISPTKTLEYLAGGKPVISTSVPDVVAVYASIVEIVDGADGWIAAIERIQSAPPQRLRERLQRAEELMSQSTWDSIAERMWTLMTARLGR